MSNPYFRKEIILNDMEGFRSGIMKGIGADSVNIIMDEIDGEHLIGYIVFIGDDEYYVTMPYYKNDREEYSIKTKEWTIEFNNDRFDGFKTLGDVFTKVKELANL
jgi:hypothetical protein